MIDKQIAAMRLRSQSIAPARFASPVEAVRWMGALQGQDAHQSPWAIGVRTLAATQADVEQGYARGEIVRGWPVRGTMHVVAAEDIGWMTALAAERRIAGDARRMRQLELTHAEIDAAGELLEAALVERSPLTRPEIMTLWQEAGIVTEGQRGYHMLWHLAQRGLICIGPMIEKQQSFALLRDWVPNPRDLSGDQALGELVLRYFASRGPATLHDFVTWSGLTLAEAKVGLTVSSDKVERWEHAGAEYWLGEHGHAASDESAAALHLLPGFDEYLLGYRERSAVLAPQQADKVVPGGNGIFLPFVVANGEVVATWKRTLRRKDVTINVAPFADHHVDRDMLLPAMQRYADFLGLALIPGASTP